MLEFYSYEGLRNGATFIVDSDTKGKLTENKDIVGKVVTITGNGEVGYGNDGDTPLGFVEQVEKEYTNRDRLAVSVVWYQSREIEVSDVAAGDVLVCDGKGGLKKLDEGYSTAFVFDSDGETAAVYIGSAKMGSGSVDIGNAKIKRYGFAATKADLNGILDTKPVDKCFYLVFDRPIGDKKYKIDVQIGANKFTAEAGNSEATWTKLYVGLGTSKSDTQFDKVDGQSASSAEVEPWPTNNGETTAQITVTYDDTNTVYGKDGKPFKSKTVTLVSSGKDDKQIG